MFTHVDGAELGKKICLLFGLIPKQVQCITITCEPGSAVTVIANMILAEEQSEKILTWLQEYEVHHKSKEHEDVTSPPSC